jgi:hypothetical protein
VAIATGGIPPDIVRTCVRMLGSVRILRHVRSHGARLVVVLRASIKPMTRREWLLILCAYRGAPAGLDPVRLQKGMFLFARTGGIPRDQQYRFKPYDYGPMSPTIYRDLDALVDEGLLTKEPVPGKQWSRYAATERGFAVADERLGRLPESAKDAARGLYAIKQRIATASFSELLEGVYREHPDMAVNSVFQRPN